MLKTECEQITAKLSPFVRREIVVYMCKKGKSGKEISQILGLTPAAISQYKSAKRGSKINASRECIKMIEECAETILKSPKNKQKLFSECVCSVCKKVKK